MLNRAEVMHFDAGEILYPGAAHFAGRVKNSTPPAALLGNLVAVAKIADRLREVFGRPLVVLSAYRSASYNRAVGGAQFSMHLDGRALDLSPIRPAFIAELHCIADELWQIDADFGGLGLYSWGVHLDTGRRRRW